MKSSDSVMFLPLWSQTTKNDHRCYGRKYVFSLNLGNKILPNAANRGYVPEYLNNRVCAVGRL